MASYLTPAFLATALATGIVPAAQAQDIFRTHPRPPAADDTPIYRQRQPQLPFAPQPQQPLGPAWQAPPSAAPPTLTPPRLGPAWQPQTLPPAATPQQPQAPYTLSNARRCVFYGDSHAQGLAMSARRMGLQVVDAGIQSVGIDNGRRDQLRDNLNLIQRGDLVVVSLGTNDFKNYMNNPAGMDNYRTNFMNRIRDIQARGGQPVILGVSTGDYAHLSQREENFLNTTFEPFIRRIAQDMRLPYIQTLDQALPRADGLHYNHEGNRLILDALQRSIGPCPQR